MLKVVLPRRDSGLAAARGEQGGVVEERQYVALGWEGHDEDVWLWWWGYHHAGWQLQMIDLTAVPVPGDRSGGAMRSVGYQDLDQQWFQEHIDRELFVR
jgi:hypothetical protein